MNTGVHVGEMIKRIVYSNHLNISDLARKIHVDRRSVYNWFKKKTLRPYTLKRICYVLVNDFSIKLPDSFYKEYLEMESVDQLSANLHTELEPESEVHTAQYWMNKYIDILEKYNEVLLKEAPREKRLPAKRR